MIQLAPAVRAGPRRQHQGAGPRQLLGRRDHLSRAGQLCRAMGHQRKRQAVARAASSPSRRRNMCGRSRGWRSGRSALPIPMRRAPALPMAGRSPTAARRAGPNLAHCYGSVGVGRDLSPDTGTGGEFYAVIGQAPRQLDRNIALVGRVVDGIDKLELAAARDRGAGLLQGQGAIRADRAHPAGERHAARPSGRHSNIMDTASAGVRELCARARQSARTSSTSAPRAGWTVQRAGAGPEEDGLRLRPPRRGRRGSCAG